MTAPPATEATAATDAASATAPPTSAPTSTGSPATRVLFYTEPELLQVWVDRSAVLTMLRTDPVDDRNTGLVDLIPGSVHVLGAPSPQQHPITGKYWVFDSFDIGGGQNTVYTASTANTVTKLTARFVPGATVSLLTSPVGLPLAVNGRDNWASYNFVWAVGSKNIISARSIGSGRLIHVERGDDTPLRIAVEDFPDQTRLAFVPLTWQFVGQYIAHVIAREPVRIVPEFTADEERADAILERHPVREFALHDGAFRQLLAELR